MKIKINLSPSSPTSSTAITHSPSSPLTILSPNGELLLIELQGSIELSTSSSVADEEGVLIGEVSFHQDAKKVTLLLSHHKLEGHIVNLVKPLAVLKKEKDTSRQGTQYDVMCIVRKKILFSKRPEPVVHS
ncbi:unnamed protein product [Sympodiomycopsis kandeliae]